MALLSAALGIFSFCGSPARAGDEAHATYILGIYQGSGLSDLAASLGNGGFQLSDTEGTWVYFTQWYHSGWKDLFIDLLTQVDADHGILWSLSTGERGEKYIIDPSLKLGFIGQTHPRPNSTLTLTVTSTLGGTLTELPCEADYGNVGGIQPVNCRLAATEMPPDETLNYLVKADPSRLSIRLSYNASF